MFCTRVLLLLILLFVENQRVWLVDEINFVRKREKKAGECAPVALANSVPSWGGGSLVLSPSSQWVRNFRKKVGEKTRETEPKKQKFSNCYFQRVLTPLQRAQNQPHSLVSRSPSPRLSASAIVSSQFAFHLANTLVQSWLKISNRKNRSF